MEDPSHQTSLCSCRVRGTVRELTLRTHFASISLMTLLNIMLKRKFKLQFTTWPALLINEMLSISLF